MVEENLECITYQLYNFYMVSEVYWSLEQLQIIEAVEFCAGGIRICSSVFLVSKLRCLSTDCDLSMPLRVAQIILHGRTGWRQC